MSSAEFGAKAEQESSGQQLASQSKANCSDYDITPSRSHISITTPIVTPGAATMIARRVVSTLSRRAIAAQPVKAVVQRSFVTSVRKQAIPPEDQKRLIPFNEVKGDDDLLPPGAQPGTVPTDYEQATGLERLEILGKMQGVDIFDMRPLDASRRGTPENPIVVKSFGDEQYLGCTGCPADSHVVIWLTVSRERPDERCPECGSCYKMEYVGPQEDPHAHDHGHGHGDHHTYEEPKTFADYVRPEYRY